MSYALYVKEQFFSRKIRLVSQARKFFLFEKEFSISL